MAIVLAFAFTLVLGMRIGADPDILPTQLKPVAGVPGSASFDEAMRLIDRDYYRKVDEGALQDAGIAAAVAKLRDRYSAYLDPRQYRMFQNHQNPHFSGVGLDVRFSPEGLFVVRAFPGTPAEAAGIKPGDIITRVGETSLKGRPVDGATALVKGRPGTSVKLTIRRPNGSVRRISVERRRIRVPAVEAKTVTGPNGTKVAVIALSGFVEGAGAQVSRAVDQQIKRGARAVVLDLRGNGGGLLDEAVAVGSEFVERGPIVTTKGRNRAREVFRASGGALPARYPVVVLVDGNSASASEIVAAAIQDTGRGKVVGERTFGKGVFQEITELPNRGALDITVGEYFTPAGRNLGGGGVKRGAGVAPDVAVARSAGPRAQLDAAVAAAAAAVAKRSK